MTISKKRSAALYPHRNRPAVRPHWTCSVPLCQSILRERQCALAKPSDGNCRARKLPRQRRSVEGPSNKRSIARLGGARQA